MSPTNPIFCALDTTEVDHARSLARSLAGAVGGMKLGLEFFAANGPEGVRAVAAGAGRVFLDLKLHDIPNTVAGAVRAVTPLAPAFLTLHCAGGAAMLRAARDAAAAAGSAPRTRLLGVTVLTSLDEDDLAATGQKSPVADQVLRLAVLAQASGLDGVVCSPQEVGMLRRECGPGFLLVVPGIRPAGSTAGDQKRIMAPREALAAGADYLVIGRPITAAPDPAAAAQALLGEALSGEDLPGDEVSAARTEERRA
jgi:orotidine-5'-phosphate decarboxylase